MILAARTLTLKNGQLCTLGSPRPADAEDMIEHMKTTAGETDFLMRYPDEFTMTVEEVISLINRLLAAPRELMILAEVNGELAGSCSLFANGNKSRCFHRCTFGIALCRKFWDLGIGSAMMDCLLEKAAEFGFEQAELEVRVRNERAIALYSKKGFMEIGRLPHAVRHRDGTYDDDIMMVKMLK